MAGPSLAQVKIRVLGTLRLKNSKLSLVERVEAKSGSGFTAEVEWREEFDSRE
jgi:hypothetical protein